MPALSDPKLELFARSVATTGSKREGAIAAGYSAADASSRGGKLIKHPKIAARVAELQQLAAKLSINHAMRPSRGAVSAIAIRDQRVAWLDDRAGRLRQIIEERAIAQVYAGEPGGTTGLLIRTFKQAGSGANAKFEDEFKVDIELLKELRAIEQQAAQELGQWTEKRELSGEDGGPLKIVISPVEARL